jgi:hypothetical protein
MGQIVVGDRVVWEGTVAVVDYVSLSGWRCGDCREVHGFLAISSLETRRGMATDVPVCQVVPV